MKNNIKSLLKFLPVVATPLFMATSCSNDNPAEPVAASAGSVSFQINLDDSIDTRALSDDTAADLLLYQVYDMEGNAVGQIGSASLSNGVLSSPISIKFEPGSYNVVFWAQYSSCDLYDTSYLQLVQIDYSKAVNNASDTDAFYNVVEVVMDGENSTETVTLYRPFAQVNVGFEEGYEDYSSSSLTVAGVYSAFNLINGQVSGNAGSVTFESAPFPQGNIIADSAAGVETEYAHVCQANVLVNNGENVDLVLTLSKEDGSSTIFNFDDVALTTNYRTNLLGTNASYGETIIPSNPEIELNLDLSSFAGIKDFYPEIPDVDDWSVDGANKAYYFNQPLNVSYDNILFTISQGSSTNIPKFYMTAAGVYDLRILNGNTIKITAPQGYELTMITLSAPSSTESVVKKLTFTDSSIGSFVFPGTKSAIWNSPDGLSVQSAEITTTSTTRINKLAVTAAPI